MKCKTVLSFIGDKMDNAIAYSWDEYKKYRVKKAHRILKKEVKK